jgi:hypothetical protein
MTTPVKRIGRPLKPAPTGQRSGLVPLGLKVTPAFKRLIDTMAQSSGRSQSRQVQYLVERCWWFDDLLAAAGATLEDVEMRRP